MNNFFLTDKHLCPRTCGAELACGRDAPTVSRLTVIGTIPSPAFQHPVVGRNPTVPVMAAGIRHDPPASW